MFWVNHKLSSYQAPVQTSAYPSKFCLFRQVVKLDGLVREGMVRSKGLGTNRLCHTDSLHFGDWVGFILGPDGVWREMLSQSGVQLASVWTPLSDLFHSPPFLYLFIVLSSPLVTSL